MADLNQIEGDLRYVAYNDAATVEFWLSKQRTGDLILLMQFAVMAGLGVGPRLSQEDAAEVLLRISDELNERILACPRDGQKRT